MLKKPQNIYMPIDKFQAKVFKNKDTMSRGQWVENFALSLAGESEDDFANELITEAQVSMYKEKLRKWKSYSKNNLIDENAGVVPTEKEIFDRCYEIFGDEFIEACNLVDSNTKKRRKNAAHEECANGFVEQTVGVNSSKGLESAKSPASTRSAGGKAASVPTAQKVHSTRCRPPQSFDEVRDFANANGLDYDDMRLWWQRNYVEREGKDKDGYDIKNWKGALIEACKAEAVKRLKRETA